VHYIFLYPVAIDLKIKKNWSWNSVLDKQTEKGMLGCARTLSEASSASTLEHLHQIFEVFHLRSSCYCQKRTSNLTEVGQKLLPSLKTYIGCMRHVSWYSYHMTVTSWVSRHCQFNCTLMQQTAWQNVFIQTLLLNLASTFLYLPGMESTNMKWVRCSIFEFISA